MSSQTVVAIDLFAHGFLWAVSGRGALLASLLLAFTPFAGAAKPCPDYIEVRRPFFGDTHVHTSYSQDANWRMGNSRTTPSDAYRFARGEQITLPPYDDAGRSLRSLKIDRPLDFAIVTDHAEDMDMVRICGDPSYSGFYSASCYRNALVLAGQRWLARWLPVAAPLCSDKSGECSAATLSVWQDTINAAQEHMDECEFTTFIGYEWSGLARGANMHRNVIFKNDHVPSEPVSAQEVHEVEGLWLRLDSECRDADTGCEAITIPHNPNLSAGRMFSPLMGNGNPITPMWHSADRGMSGWQRSISTRAILNVISGQTLQWMNCVVLRNCPIAVFSESTSVF
ncbi:MAG: DUF3604 domain-containing protein [Halioglobus sp.]|nr:DUF3604 domain-containing protein [Halioglobus sp.]